MFHPFAYNTRTYYYVIHQPSPILADYIIELPLPTKASLHQSMDRLASCFSLYSVGHLGSLITSIFEPKDDHGWAVMSGKFYANYAFNIIIGWIASSDDLAKKMDNWAVKRSTELATAELAALPKEVDSELHVNASDLTREKIDACNPTVVASLITKRLPLYTQLVVEPALAVVSKEHRKRKKDSDEADAEIELRRLKMLSSIAEILFVMNRRYNRLQTGVTISLSYHFIRPHQWHQPMHILHVLFVTAVKVILPG